MNSEPKPPVGNWELPETPELLQNASALRERSPGADARLWQRIALDTVNKPATFPFATVAIAIAGAAVGIAIAVALFQPHSPADGSHVVAVGTDVHLEVSPGAALDVLEASGTQPSFKATRQVILLSGQLRAKVDKQPPGSVFAIITPHLRVIVVGTRFSVNVGEDQTRVDVQEGRVRVDSANGIGVHVMAGESILSTDPRLSTPQVPIARGHSTCDASGTDAERRACYQKLAQGSGLAAENALFLLGLGSEKGGDIAGALTQWQTLSRRFPNGAFAPEAQLGSLRALIAQRRFDEALGAADEFRARFTSDTRIPDVMFMRAKILCSTPTKGAAALESFGEILALDTATAEIQQEALFAMGACQQANGDRQGAINSWRSYQQRFPDGPHAAEASKLVAEEAIP